MMSAASSARPGSAGGAIGVVPQPVLTVTDLRQWRYCPRVTFYQYFPPARRVVTFKMQEGQDMHARTADLEHRRTLAAYHLADGERRYDLALRSQRLGLRGRLDMAILRDAEAIPVEFKSGNGPLAANHRLQLAAQALLLEEHTALPVRRAFVYWVARRRAQEVRISDKPRQSVPEALAEIRRCIATGLLPTATSQRGRCVDCEFRRFCGDLW